MGQGSDTAMAQIAAEVLGIPAEAVAVVHSDTDVTPYDMATLGSRSTFHMGHAVQLAAEDAREQARGARRASSASAAGCSNVDRSRRACFQLSHATACRPATSSARQLHAALRAARPRHRPVRQHHAVLDDRRRRRRDRGRHRDRPRPRDQAGHRRRRRARRSIPRSSRRQLSGAAIMQLGFTALRGDGVRATARSPTRRSPTTRSRASSTFRRDRDRRVVDEPQPNGPFGAKGVGESGTFGVSPAIANAIDDAVGRARLTEMPLTARERLSRDLRGRRRRAARRMTMSAASRSHPLHAQRPHGRGRRRAARERSSRCCSDQLRAVRRARKLRQGLCGCCTRAGRRRRGVGLPAIWRRSSTAPTVTTIERLADGRRLDPVQQAFIEDGAFQCGFCTPGFILMTRELLERTSGSRATTRSAITWPAICAAARPIRRSSRPCKLPRRSANLQ